jgi:hypothetical protein
VSGPKRTVGAFLLSFAVYLTPLVGPHAAWFLGEVVWRGLSRGSGLRAREPLWVATEIAVALAAQLVFCLLLYWFLGRPGWLRGLCVAAPILPAIAALNYAFMVTIPARFLIERDTAPEQTSWTPECTARDVWIPHIAASIFVERAASIWVVETQPPNRYGLFDAARCTVRWLELTHSGFGSATFVAGTRALYMTMTPSSARPQWLVFDTGSGARWPLAVDEGRSPILSTDGYFAAWLRPVAGSTPPIQLEAVVRAVERGAERVVDLTAIGPSVQQLVQVDMEAGELVVARGLKSLLVVGLDGRVRKTLPTPPDVEPQPQTFRFLADGWVIWDAYREGDPYRVAWSLPGGTGVRRVPKGSSITSLAPSPDGRFIAVSTTSSLSIGSTPDAVFVLRAADGSEAFRRYFPKYTRGSVAFAGVDYFVYTDLAGVNALRVE